MSDSVPAGVDAPVVGQDGSQSRGRTGRGLAKADAEAIGAALDADPVVLRGAVARSLEVLTDAGRGHPWSELVARAARRGDWDPERTAALADPDATGHRAALWDLATELIEGRGRDLTRIDLVGRDLAGDDRAGNDRAEEP
jgi:hypothetical protein